VVRLDETFGVTRHSALGVFDQNLANYSSAWSAVEYTREEGLRPIEQQLISEFMPPPAARVLDLGCGAGRTTIGLARAGYQTVAIDLSIALLTLARRRYPGIEFREMDAANLHFAPEQFDAALFSYNGIDCLYPVTAREQCLQEVFRVLKPGGVFILSSHNVVGAVFSGGYWYLRGYLNAVGTLMNQRRNPHLLEWYVRYADAGGTQFLYSAPPDRTVAQLRRAGFDVLAVRGASGQRHPGRVRRREQHVYFVARKPAA
jgi:ubiquinone/menaquinone biosynthesis C-methylase UbiE